MAQAPQSISLNNWVSQLPVSNDEPSNCIMLSVKPIVISEQLSIEFSMTNISNLNLKFSRSDLPWANPIGLDLFCIAPDGTTYQKSLHLHGLSPQSLTIRPGHTAKGTIPLASLVCLPEDVAPSNLVMLWSYHLPSNHKHNPVRGFMEIPASLFPSRPNQSINAARFAGSDPAAFGGRSGYVGR